VVGDTGNWLPVAEGQEVLGNLIDKKCRMPSMGGTGNWLVAGVAQQQEA
jgi:hypothetical protein